MRPNMQKFQATKWHHRTNLTPFTRTELIKNEYLYPELINDWRKFSVVFSCHKTRPFPLASESLVPAGTQCSFNIIPFSVPYFSSHASHFRSLFAKAVTYELRVSSTRAPGSGGGGGGVGFRNGGHLSKDEWFACRRSFQKIIYLWGADVIWASPSWEHRKCNGSIQSHW